MKTNDIKNKKVILYSTRSIILLNSKCNGVIKEEKLRRAIVMFTNRDEDFETIKSMIDWHVENETRQYFESLRIKNYFMKQNQNKVLRRR